MTDAPAVGECTQFLEGRFIEHLPGVNSRQMLGATETVPALWEVPGWCPGLGPRQSQPYGQLMGRRHRQQEGRDMVWSWPSSPCSERPLMSPHQALLFDVSSWPFGVLGSAIPSRAKRVWTGCGKHFTAFACFCRCTARSQQPSPLTPMLLLI